MLLAGPIEVPASDVRLFVAAFVGVPLLAIIGAPVALSRLLRGAKRIQPPAPPQEPELEVSPGSGRGPDR